MAKSGTQRTTEYRGRKKERRLRVLLAIESIPPEYADDCKMWIAPPGLKDERPRVNWDIGAKTHALMADHADAHGVTLDELLREVGVMFCMKRPDIYWAMKSAKINISDN